MQNAHSSVMLLAWIWSTGILLLLGFSHWEDCSFARWWMLAQKALSLLMPFYAVIDIGSTTLYARIKWTDVRWHQYTFVENET